VTLVSVGDCVKPGTYRLHSCFRRAVNYERGGRLVSVVDESIGPGPVNIVIRANSKALSADFQSALPGSLLRSPLEIRPRTVLFAGQRYPFTSRQRYHSSLESTTFDLRRFRRNGATFGRLLQWTAPPQSLAFLLDEARLRHFRSGSEQAFARQIRSGVQSILRGRLLAGVGKLKGCGLGLTPSGDDFIAGLLIGLNLLQELHGDDLQPLAGIIFRAAQGTNLLSNTALDLARHGRLFGRAKDLVRALVSGNERSLRRATRRLLSVGATSGADLGTGLFVAAQAAWRIDPAAQSCPRRTSSRVSKRENSHRKAAMST
jgi:hypothetical protein